MRILIACEFSGTVRDAFLARGHDAWSCDLLPTEAPGPHYQCDVREVLHLGWDRLIGFPDCTYVCGSGLHWNNRGRGWEKTEAAVDFFRLLWTAPIRQVILENPVGLLSSRICKPTQIIQPYQFGEDASKKTCLWLGGGNAFAAHKVRAAPDDRRQAAMGKPNRQRAKQARAFRRQVEAPRQNLQRHRAGDGRTVDLNQ